MDMRTKFRFVIDDDNEDILYMCETWQDALPEFIGAMQADGFTIDEKRKRQIIELAKFGRVTV
jgi:hypothetical protein